MALASRGTAPRHVGHGAWPTDACAKRFDGAAVLTITDALGHAEPATVGASIETVLGRLDAVLNARPRVVVANLGHVQPSRFVVGLLSIMRRRAARAGAPLVLAGASAALREQLDAARVSALYTTFPSVSQALRALGERPHGRSRSPGSSSNATVTVDTTCTSAAG